MFSLFSFFLTSTVYSEPCGTMSRIFSAPEFPKEGIVVIAEGEKLVRDAYSGSIDGLITDNFALKWGSDYGGSPFGNIILSAFETLWEVQVLEWGHAYPYGSETHLFNLYIGNTGPEVPSIPDYVAGYYTRDIEGWPMIVLNPQSLGAEPSAVFALLAHEFYHAVQDAEESFQTPLSRWIWEPTANWASKQFVSDDSTHYMGLDSYLLLSEKSLRFFQPAENLLPEEYYTYGASLFPIHMDERLGEPLLIPDIWKRGTPEGDAISVISEILSEQGFSFLDVWMDHNEGAISLNYEQGALYRDLVTTEWYTETWTEEGVGIHEADTDQAIENLGFHAHRLYAPTQPIVRVQLWGEPIGTMSSLGEFAARVVHETPTETFSYELDMSNYFNEIRLNVAEEDEVYLVVGVLADTPRSLFDSGETFTYSFAMEGIALPPEYTPIEDDDTGLNLDIDVWELVCGCNHVDPISASAGLWAMFFYWRRRRL
jgi:hypothetical protein